MLNIRQYEALIVIPTLGHLRLDSPTARILLLGTPLVESRLTWLRQRGGGPALSLNQIEPDTHDDLYDNFLRYRRRRKVRLESLLVPGRDRHEQLITNLAYAAAVTRLIYFRHKEPLPPPGNIWAIASYWKRYFNTADGKGDPAEFVKRWRRYGTTKGTK